MAGGEGSSGQHWLDGPSANANAGGSSGISTSSQVGLESAVNNLTNNINTASSSPTMERNGSASSSNSAHSRGHKERLSPHASPTLSNERGSFTPPPRRVGASLPLPSNPTQATTSHRIGPQNTSIATHAYSNRYPLNNMKRLRHILRYSYNGLSELFNIIHPTRWSMITHLTDQASWSLICYKLYVLSITLPVNSKLYFYYLPSCLLSDLVAVLLLQLSWWILFGRGETGVRNGGVRTPVMKHSSTNDDGNGRNWRSRIAITRASILNRTPLFKSYNYTALPFDTSMSTSSNTTISPQAPRNVLNNARSISQSAVSGLGITRIGNEQIREEEGRSLLTDWDDETPTRGNGARNDRVSTPLPGSTTVTGLSETREVGKYYGSNSTIAAGAMKYDDNFKEEGIHNEDAIVVEGEEENASSLQKIEYDEDLLRSALGTERRTLASIAKNLIWFVLKTIHVIACLVAIVFTVIAIGAYSAGRVVFSWQGAFDSSSNAGYLFSMAMSEFPHFLATYASILGLGTGTTFLRCWIPRLIENGTLSSGKFSKYIPNGRKIRITLAFIVIVSFLSICAAVRPPQALPATDLLIDGVTATSAILLFKDEHTHPIALNKNTTIYGQSNAFQPRLTPINTEEIKHVFFIFLESADHLAWPYQPDKFCKHRNCEDMEEKYNKVEEFTPFFDDLVKNDPNTIFINDFRTNLAYTIKAHLSSMCGIYPHVRDYISSEAELDSPTACLPHLLKALSDDENEIDEDIDRREINVSNDDNNKKKRERQGEEKLNRGNRFKNWKTGWFQAQMTAYDRQREVIQKQGFDEIWDSNTLTAKFGQKKEWTNYFGYSDEELYPLLWEWIDDRLKNNENILMTTAGATMHHPFTVPPWVEKTEYTKTEWTNKYLNVVKRTDRDLKLFFDGLKSRNLLDKSLVIIQGDHGPRIGEDGIYVDYGWWEHIYRVPLAIRAPGLLPHQIEQDPTRPYIALDILPTILDALGVKPSILKSFVGQSIFRARSRRHLRDSYHAQSRGGQYPHHLRTLKHNTYKAIRLDTGDTCATDVKVDFSETFFYCVTEGWRKVFEGEELKDGLMKGLWKQGSKEEKLLIDYAHEAKSLLDIHLQVNDDFWNVAKNKEANKELKENFLKTVHEQAHWH